MFNAQASWRLVSIVGLIIWLGGERAHAQWGGFGDMGFGFGFGLGPQTPASVSFLNDHAIARTHAAAAARPQPIRAPIPVSRDFEYFNKYDAKTRRVMEDRVSRRRLIPRAKPAEAQTSAVADTAPTPPPARPLATFFDKMRQLVWPADAPREGELAAKRAAADLKSSEVLMEIEARGHAFLATKADARNKLLDYGRPALQFLRDTSTTAVSDTFHAFLLALYDSIGQAPEAPRQ